MYEYLNYEDYCRRTFNAETRRAARKLFALWFPFAPHPHSPRVATTEAKRQRHRRAIAIARREGRQLKARPELRER